MSLNHPAGTQRSVFPHLLDQAFSSSPPPHWVYQRIALSPDMRFDRQSRNKKTWEFAALNHGISDRDRTARWLAPTGEIRPNMFGWLTRSREPIEKWVNSTGPEHIPLGTLSTSRLCYLAQTGFHSTRLDQAVFGICRKRYGVTADISLLRFCPSVSARTED